MNEKKPTALAQARLDNAQLRDQLAITELAAVLALTTKPDLRWSIRESDRTRYVVEAYGLTRACGGVLAIRFIAAGQSESITFYRFDDWRSRLTGLPQFAVAAERIARRRAQLLEEGR